MDFDRVFLSKEDFLVSRLGAAAIEGRDYVPAGLKQVGEGQLVVAVAENDVLVVHIADMPSDEHEGFGLVRRVGNEGAVRHGDVLGDAVGIETELQQTFGQCISERPTIGS